MDASIFLHQYLEEFSHLHPEALPYIMPLSVKGFLGLWEFSCRVGMVIPIVPLSILTQDTWKYKCFNL